MDTSTSITNKGALDLLKGISLSTSLQKSKDSILLAEDQYPENLDPIFGKTEATSDLHRTIEILNWNRKSDRELLDAGVYERMVTAQDTVRSTLNLTPTTDNPWEKHVFKDWVHRITNICLQAVQKALESCNKYNANLIFSPGDATAAGNVHSNAFTRTSHSKANIEGLLLYHPMIVNNPWEAPKRLDALIDDVIAERKTYLVQRAYNPWDQHDADKARAQIEELKGSLKPLLMRIYTYTSNAFHVLLKHLIPRADKNYLFTRIKGARMEHILRHREWKEGRRSATLPALTAEEKKHHSAAHTLRFIQTHYVDVDDDAPHTTWDRILKATRDPKMSLYAWVDSFTVHVLRHTESTAKKLGKTKRIKINKIIAKQITEDEKLIITTINQTYTSAFISAGDYQRNDLINLLAQHTSNFAAKKYIPSEHPRIITYLKIRARNSGTPLPSFLTQQPRTPTSTTPLKRRRLTAPTQRAWTYLAGASTLEGKGKGYGYKGKDMGKGKSKGRGKGYKGKTHISPKGKHFTKGSIYYANKGGSFIKGKGKPKGNRTYPAIRTSIATTPAHSQVTTVNSSGQGTSSSPAATSPSVRCHFCNKIGHYKNNCRQFQALRNSPAYQSKLSQAPRAQLIYDHLEDAVFAPKVCSTSSCTNQDCDGYNCYTTFSQEDFQVAETYFNEHLLSSVENVKLDRHVDSTPPMTRSVYVTQEADWGDYQWYGQGYQDEQWQNYDENYQEYAMEQQDDFGADDIERDEETNEEAYVGEGGYDSEEAEEHQLLTINDDAEGEEDDEGYE